ncbi:TPR-domain containing protein [Tamlana sedimentorum]|uniref:TPR-domain containing protein n=1 Tax=Neotamlana sedimentorum TaxID=1435349 RepID=A0A0D7WCN8_9FLAO|nr:tetratricopeptide repeat protein [Tamlana sedimentorum]KJD36930.1 TPR-domain containing protein [Tamlana sedimentorum]
MIRISCLLLLVFFKTEAQTSVLNVGDSLFVLGNYSKAIHAYKSLSNQPEVYDKLAKAYTAIGNYDDALKYYELGVESNPQNTLLKYDYAKLLSGTKKFKEAKSMFSSLIKTDSLNPNFHYELGLVLEKLNDSTAINAFKTTFSLDNTHQKAIYEIAKMHLQQREYAQVDEYVDKGLESYQNNVKLISLKAQNYFWSQNYHEAIAWFEKLLDLGEKSAFVYEKISLSYAQHFNYEKAIEYRLKALKFNPHDATALYVIGTYYLNTNDYENAEKFIDDALFLLDKPLDKEYMKLATVFNLQKKYKESIETLKKAIKEAPDNYFAHFQMAATLDSYYEDYDARIKVYENLLKKFSDKGMNPFIEDRISKLKQEKFIKEGEKKD